MSKTTEFSGEIQLYQMSGQVHSAFAFLTKKANETAIKNGFYDDQYAVREKLCEVRDEAKAGTELFEQTQQHIDWLESTSEQASLARIHSEVSECLEAVRHPLSPDKHCPQFSCQEVELADVLIRIFDFCAEKKYRLSEAVLAKMAYNETRPYKHGKNS